MLISATHTQVVKKLVGVAIMVPIAHIDNALLHRLHHQLVLCSVLLLRISSSENKERKLKQKLHTTNRRWRKNFAIQTSCDGGGGGGGFCSSAIS
eukprot:SAG11_NODE_19630_length_462_cov_1.234160_1_plen_94_part_01